jgi:ferric-dicitrate binding protein FerR (iron transport regulator)
VSDFDSDHAGGRATSKDYAARSRDETSDELRDEPGIARVLRAAGGRSRPADDMKQAVRAAVHAEWRASVAKRSQRRVWMALAASVAVAALALWVGRSYFSGSNELMASVSRTVGEVQSRTGSLGSWHTLAAADSAHAPLQLHVGEEVMTGSEGRAALQLSDGVSLRLDHDTRIALIDAGRVDVRAGAVYVDAGTAPHGSERLRVGTPAGMVQHVGTQYEARIVNSGTRIRVREGRVDLLPEHGSVQTAAVGEQLFVSVTGQIERGPIAPSDAEWQWAANTAPSFNIDGSAVRAFLTWAGRELGREVIFATPESEAEADRAVLSGSITGLTPSEALSAVLPTTALRSTEHDGKLEIALQ